MPELPEVETTGRGISPHILGKKIEHVVVRHRQLRWLIEPNFEANLLGECIESVTRRAKYLLIKTPTGTLIAHLGMSGNLRIVDESAPVMITLISFLMKIPSCDLTINVDLVR
jgi:formamidopyrimidine-DNA glycosylase